MANIVIANTKGGAGKSFLATQIVPLALEIGNINIFEIDDNNKTSLQSNIIQFKHLDTHNIDEILFEVEIGDLNIIDAGGGNDTKEVIKALKDNNVNVDYFIVPATKDFEVIKNIKDTIDLIRENYADSFIYLVLNKVKEKDNLKDEFMYLFGSSEYEIKGVIDELKVNKIVAVSDYNEIDIVKNIYKTTAVDLIQSGADIVNNFEKYKKQWIEEAMKKFEDKKTQSDYYKKKMAFYRLLKKLFTIKESIKNVFEF